MKIKQFLSLLLVTVFCIHMTAITTVCASQNAAVIGGVVHDTTPPTGTIAISENHTWKSFLYDISFGLLFEKSQTVTITAEDDKNGVGLASVGYFTATKALSLDTVQAYTDWITTTNSSVSFTVNQTGTTVVYARLVDKENNTAYLSSEGFTITGGHKFTNYVSNNDTTCLRDGTKTAKCDYCDETDTVTDVGTKKSHTPTEQVKENITEDDNFIYYDTVVYCSVCHSELSRISHADPKSKTEEDTAVYVNMQINTVKVKSTVVEQSVINSVTSDLTSEQKEVLKQTIEDTINQATADTVISGVGEALKKDVDVSDAIIKSSGVNLTNSSTIEVDIVVQISVVAAEIDEDSVSSTTVDNPQLEMIKFDLTPVATVVTKDNDGNQIDKKDNVPIAESNFDTTKDITISVDTGGIVPSYIQHISSVDNSVETFYKNGQKTFSFDEDKSVATFKIKHFSSIVVYGTKIDLKDCTVYVDNTVYNGNPVKPTVVVKAADGNIIDASEYDVVYSNNNAVGTGTVSITPSATGTLLEGSTSKTFTITAHVHSAKASAEWQSNSIKHWKYCSSGDGIKVDEAEHKLDAGKITTEPTCTKTGVKTYTCTICGKTVTEIVDKTEHKYAEQVIAPTRKSEGYTVYTCSVCGQSYKSDYTNKLECFIATVKALGNKDKLSWNKVTGATEYKIYGGACGRDIKLIASTSKTAYKIKNRKSTRNYKYYVVACDANGKTLKRTLTVHSAHVGKCFTNAKSIAVSKNVLTLKVDGVSAIKPRIVKYDKNKALLGIEHAPSIRYIVDNPDIVTISSNGKIMAKKTGTCTIYVIAADGVYTMVDVTVK